MYTTVAILALSLAVHFESQETQADINPAGYIFGMHDQFVITVSGEVWDADDTDGWVRKPELDPPVPLNEIAMYMGTRFVATNGDTWVFKTASAWENFGLPVDPTSVDELGPEAKDNQAAGGCSPSLFGSK